MPWKECHAMDERLRFVARLLEGEKMAPLCAEFGISRKTGYKIFERYKDCGVAAFTDRSRRPVDQTENGVRGSQIACRNLPILSRSTFWQPQPGREEWPQPRSALG